MLTIDRNKYPEAPYPDYLKFTHPGHAGVHTALSSRLAYMCKVKGKMLTITRGFVSYAEQKAIGDAYMRAHPNWHRTENGAVYNLYWKCMVAAPGNSNHEFGHAVDSGDNWLKAMTNTEMAKYGLVKPMSYEPWHVQLIETKGQAKSVLRADFRRRRDDMGIEKLQAALAAVGLYTGRIDGINGPKTRAATKEFMQTAHEVLGTDFKTAEETIKGTQKSPDHWLPKLKTEQYFADFIMNIVRKMKGE